LPPAGTGGLTAGRKTPENNAFSGVFVFVLLRVGTHAFSV
jgi:hypothetical protein